LSEEGKIVIRNIYKNLTFKERKSKFVGGNKMKLNMLERLKILQMLPETGTFITLNIIQKFKESLAPTEKELKDFEMVEKDGNITWNKKS